MTKKQVKFARHGFAAHLAWLTFCVSVTCSLTITANATITWSGGTNTVGPDMTLQDTHIVISGGVNIVQGLAGPPAGSSSGGVLRLLTGGSGLQITGAALTLNSDNTSPGILLLQGDVSTFASSAAAVIASGGSANKAGEVDLGSATRTFTVASGSVPSGGSDLGIFAQLTDGGLIKAGTGILALSGANNYQGGTRLDAGTLYINSAMALGTQDLTIGGAGTTIDNRSGMALTLPNNPLILIGGDLNFVGTNDLNFGTGFSVIADAGVRTITVQNPAATLTLSGDIGDNGQHVALNKSGAGTLVLSGNNLYTGGTTVTNGALVLNGSTNSGASVAAGATLVNNGAIGGNTSVSGVMSGSGTIHGSLVVNNGGIMNVNGGTLTVDGAVTNNGLFILRHGAQITTGSGFVNNMNATLDISTAGSVPANLTNNGTLIDSSVVTTKTAAKAGTTITLTINSYSGHSYQLQKSTTTPEGTTFTTNVGSVQQGTTGNVLTFTDSSASGPKSFYRIVVDS